MGGVVLLFVWIHAYEAPLGVWRQLDFQFSESCFTAVVATKTEMNACHYIETNSSVIGTMGYAQ